MIAALLKMMIHPYNMSECVQYFVQRGYTPFVE